MISTCRLGSLLRAGALGYVGLGAIAGSTGAWLGAFAGVALGWLWHSRLSSACSLPASKRDDDSREDDGAATSASPRT